MLWRGLPGARDRRARCLRFGNLGADVSAAALPLPGRTEIWKSERFNFRYNVERRFRGGIMSIDVWATARLLTERHGTDATAVAEMRADEYATRGDLAGQAAWRRVALAAAELLDLASRGLEQ
jgi:hypothetical protein